MVICEPLDKAAAGAACGIDGCGEAVMAAGGVVAPKMLSGGAVYLGPTGAVLPGKKRQLMVTLSSANSSRRAKWLEGFHAWSRRPSGPQFYAASAQGEARGETHY